MTQSEMVRPIFIGRWTPKILFSLRERPYRHGHQRRRLGRISQRMLTRNLRQLESNGLVSRRVMHSRRQLPSNTPLRRTLVAPLGGMCRWAERYRKDVMAEVHVSRPGLG